ncbi:hypothetical protein KR018_009163 [Drosophila ironensis]|nr:hypothetical protein KR018_009163 [Drosophila ironensis]
MQYVLTCCLLAILLHWTDGSGQDLDEANVASENNLDARVVGGEKTSVAALGGYILALRYKDKFICAGTLIHEMFAMTAAHCFVGRMNGEDWRVVGGTSNIYGNLTGIATYRTPEKIIIPPQYSLYTNNMDIALVLFSKPMKGSNIQPMALCRRKLQPGTLTRVSGWGSGDYKEKYPRKQLHTIIVPITDIKVCHQTYLTKNTIITANMLCAHVPGKKDACMYDSGGPMVFRDQVCGIVSFGYECATVLYPGVYTDVMQLKPYIQEVVKKHGYIV